MDDVFVFVVAPIASFIAAFLVGYLRNRRRMAKKWRLAGAFSPRAGTELSRRGRDSNPSAARTLAQIAGCSQARIVGARRVSLAPVGDDWIFSGDDLATGG
jgi:hypothetical protein